MIKQTIRLSAVCMLFGVAAPVVPTGALPVAQTASTDVQAVSGGGIGMRSADPAPIVEHLGLYSSTGQLGNGRYLVEEADGEASASFTRTDGMKLTGTTHHIPGGGGDATPDCLMVVLDGSDDIAHAELRLALNVDFGHSARSSFL